MTKRRNLSATQALAELVGAQDGLRKAVHFEWGEPWNKVYRDRVEAAKGRLEEAWNQAEWVVADAKVRAAKKSKIT